MVPFERRAEISRRRNWRCSGFRNADEWQRRRFHMTGEMQEAGSRKQEAGSRKQEAGSRGMTEGRQATMRLTSLMIATVSFRPCLSLPASSSYQLIVLVAPVTPFTTLYMNSRPC